MTFPIEEFIQQMGVNRHEAICEAVSRNIRLKVEKIEDEMEEIFTQDVIWTSLRRVLLEQVPSYGDEE